MSQAKNIRSQKVQELQQSNDQLFGELRQANEKYLDVRVENNKLKDQISTLRLNVESLKQKESAPTRQRNLSSSGGGTYTAASRRKAGESNQSAISQSAETEQLRNSHETLKVEVSQVCSQVKTFMKSMRALQKAVSKKTPDVTEQKQSFDQSKKELETIVEKTLDKLKNQAQQNHNLPLQKSNIPQGSSTKTKSVSAMRGQQYNQQKENNFGQSSSMRPSSNGSGYFGSKRGSAVSKNQFGYDNELSLNLLQKQVNGLQNEKDKMRELIEELKQTNQFYSDERDAMEEKLKSKSGQVHKYASQCQINSHKVQMLEQVVSVYKNTMVDLSSNVKIQQVLSDQGQETILQLKGNLIDKEDKLKTKLKEDINRVFVNLKIDPQFVLLRDELTSQVELKERLMDQQFEKLTSRVTEKEEDLQRLKLIFVEKLRELETSFVEISNEVVETDKVTQDVTAKRKLEFKTLLDSQPTINQDKNNLDISVESILSNFDDDEKSRQIEELIQANHDLMEQNEKLKKEGTDADEQAQAQLLISNPSEAKNSKQRAASDSLHAEMVIELNEQIDEVKQQYEKQRMSLKLTTAQEALHKKEIQGLKYDNKRMTMDLKDSKERYEKNRIDYQQQFNALKQTTIVMKSQQQKEYDLRTTNETKYMAAQKQLKIARVENQEQQTEMLIMMKRLDDLQSEQEYVKHLKDCSESSDENEADTKETDQPLDIDAEEESKKIQSKSERKETKEAEDLKEMEARIQEDPTEAVRYYHRILTLTKQEFKSVNRQYQKLRDQQLSGLGSNKSDLHKILKEDDAEEKQTNNEEDKQEKDQDEPKSSFKDSKTFSGSQEQLRQQITNELEEKHQKQQQEMIQTYKRTQRDSNEKHQAALLALQNSLTAGGESQEAAKDVIELRAQMKAEHELIIQKLEEDNGQQLHKAQKATRLMICLQNRVREMISSKLQDAMITIKSKETLYDSLKEDLQDVTDTHNMKIISLREDFEKEKQDETAQIIQKYQDEMRALESKVSKEAEESKLRDGQESMSDLIKKLEQEKAAEVQEKENQLLAAQAEHQLASARSKKSMSVVISMQNCVRDLLKDRLEKREQELKLEIIQVNQKFDDISKQLKDNQDEFERYRQDKEGNSGSKIDAVEAQIQSLKSVQDALEREKADLQMQNEQMDDEVHRMKAKLLEMKGQVEVKDMRIEEIQEQMAELLQKENAKKDSTTIELKTKMSMATNEEVKGNESELSFALLQQENADLKDQVEKLRQDSGSAGERESLGRGSWASDQVSNNNPVVEEQLRHIRSCLTQFLTKLPVQVKQNEEILTIVFSMLKFPTEEIEEIKQQRAALSSPTQNKKGGKKNNKR